jgi:hypothetical protein
VTRIIYVFFSSGGVQGGHKMILRHVETLRDLGFDAYAYTGRVNQSPWWFEHRAPVLVEEPLSPDRDILVLPDDGETVLKQFAARTYRVFVFVQNPYLYAAKGMGVVAQYPAERFPGFLTVSAGTEALLKRLYPSAVVDKVRAFADERVFRPGASREHAVALVPRKRKLEAEMIGAFFRGLHPEHAGLPWRAIPDSSERDVAAAFADSSVFLSLSRLESVGMTPLEAMASGALVAGFTGLGGREYASPDNGFWVEEDDCVAAADAVARACDLARRGGPELTRRLEAGYETARAWSYAAFRTELEETWMRLAPKARIRNGPLD